MSAPTLVVVGWVAHGEDPHGEPTYVVTRRAPGTHLAGSWELPGGKVEAGESPREALVRELHEELGVTVEAAEPITFSWHAYGERTVLILFFAVRLSTESAAPSARVASDLRLLNRTGLLALEMPEANEPFRRWLASELP